MVASTIGVLIKKEGLKSAVSSLVGDEVMKSLLRTYRVPDWQQLYVKLATKFPDKSWQTALNFLNVGRSGVSFEK